MAATRTPASAGTAAAQALLLLCARRELTAEEGAELRRRVAAPLAWAELLALGHRHRLLPLLHRHLREVRLPPGVADELRATQRHELHRSLQLSAELLRLSDLLVAEGVRAVAYKGPLLALAAYGDLGLRGFADLDLLVTPGEIPAASRLLEREGYRLRRPLSPAQERHFRAVDGDYGMLQRDTGVLVELHARASSRRFGMPLETAELRARAGQVALGGGAVLGLGDDDQLLVQCIHGAKHRWRSLEWVVALAELLRQGRGDPAAVLARAASLHARRTVLVGLELARSALGAPLPAQAAAAIAADPGVRRLAAEAREGLLAPAPALTTVANLRYNLALRDGPADRARYIARWVFSPSPEDWEAHPLPDLLFPLYRLLRPLRLARRYASGRSGEEA